jgi:hypothetical protein
VAGSDWQHFVVLVLQMAGVHRRGRTGAAGFRDGGWFYSWCRLTDDGALQRRGQAAVLLLCSQTSRW